MRKPTNEHRQPAEPSRRAIEQLVMEVGGEENLRSGVKGLDRFKNPWDVTLVEPAKPAHQDADAELSTLVLASLISRARILADLWIDEKLLSRAAGRLAKAGGAGTLSVSRAAGALNKDLHHSLARRDLWLACRAKARLRCTPEQHDALVAAAMNRDPAGSCPW